MANRAMESRLVGRVFTYADRLYLVTGVDSQTGFARMTYQVHGRRSIVQFPISEVLWRLMCETLSAEARALE